MSKLDFKKIMLKLELNKIWKTVYLVVFVFSLVLGMRIGNVLTSTEKIHILCMGIDKMVPMTERDPLTNSIGQADAIYLVTVDPSKDDVSIVAIPRDTIVQIEKYNSKMQYMGEEMGQICIQYAYADGQERSCELTCDRVESLFHAIDIDAYVAININAIMALNDAVGGVEVTVNDEYTAYQMSVWNGSTITLDGMGAMNYLRVRDTNQYETAYGRMDRIKEYISAFISTAIDETKENPSTIMKMYRAVKENMVTDVTLSDIMIIKNVLQDVSLDEIEFYTLEGEIKHGLTGYEEFYPNIDQLIEINNIIQ